MSSSTVTRPTISEMPERPEAEPPRAAADPALVRDPICGMTFAPDEAAATRVADGVTYHFCAERCARMFDRQRQQRDALASQAPAPSPPVPGPSARVSAPRAAGSAVPGWLVPALGVAAVVAVLAVTVFGVPTSTLLTGALILACPLMHVFMMRGHGGHGNQGGQSGGDHAAHASGAQKPAAGGARRSCH